RRPGGTHHGLVWRVAGCPNSQKYSVVRSFLKHLFTHQPRTHRSWQTPHKSNSEQVVLKLLCISAGATLMHENAKPGCDSEARQATDEAANEKVGGLSTL